MKNAWFDVRFAHAVVRQLVYRGMFRTGFTDGAGSSVVDLGCLDAPQFVPTGYCKVGTQGEPTCGFGHRFTAWEFGRENRECVEQFAQSHVDQVLFLVYRLGVLNKCRQYTFDSVPALLKWAQRAPYSREVLEVQVAIDRQRIGSMFVRPGRILQSLADFNRWHSGRVA